MRRRKPIQVLPRFRILVGSEIAIGPGKANLLEAIEEAGSIQLAARSMGMSYMRAWNLIQTMNKCFHEPIITATRGGGQGGEAHLTKLGKKILTLYRKMEKKSTISTEKYWKDIISELKR